MNLLSKRVLERTGELASELPTASEDAVESNKQRDGQKSTATEAMPSIAAPISVVPVRAEVRAMEAVRVPKRPEDKAENQRDCDEDEDGWDDDEGEHCVSLDSNCVESCPAHRIRDLGEPGKSQAERASPFSRGFIAFTLAMRS